MKENTEIFKLLLAKKCDIDNPDDINGNSPLFLATTLKQIDTMKALIGAKADVNLVDWEGKSPAHFAAYAGFGEELHLLCTSGADVKTKEGAEADGKTVAEMADSVGGDYCAWPWTQGWLELLSESCNEEVLNSDAM